ncbi:MAG: single-stranded DNA-binding protein [Bacilli bacterium]
MLNNLVLVGRLADNPRLHVFNDGVKVCHFVMAVERPFQNQESGNYDVDFIPVSVWRGFSDAMMQFCKKGSTIGIKGRLSMKQTECNGIKVNQIEVIAERVSFINLKRDPKEVKEEENLEST